MNKRWRNSLFLLSIVFIVWLVFTPSENNVLSNETKIEDWFMNVQQLHWGHLPITYKIINIEDCQGVAFRNLNNSFYIIENLTDKIVDFKEVENNADIEVVCINRDKILEIEEKVTRCKNVSFDYYKTNISTYKEGVLNFTTQLFFSAKTISRNEFLTVYEVCYAEREDMGIYGKIIEFGTAGEALPNIIGNTIVNSSIFLYDNVDRNCADFPARELHELLHVFGFGHLGEVADLGGYLFVPGNASVHDVMYPILYCKDQKQLDKKYTDCLKYIYSNKQIGGCGLDVKFLEFEYQCLDGWYPVEGSYYCCPEPNMKINEKGYCV